MANVGAILCPDGEAAAATAVVDAKVRIADAARGVVATDRTPRHATPRQILKFSPKREIFTAMQNRTTPVNCLDDAQRTAFETYVRDVVTAVAPIKHDDGDCIEATLTPDQHAKFNAVAIVLFAQIDP